MSPNDYVDLVIFLTADKAHLNAIPRTLNDLVAMCQLHLPDATVNRSNVRSATKKVGIKIKGENGNSTRVTVATLAAEVAALREENLVMEQRLAHLEAVNPKPLIK